MILCTQCKGYGKTDGFNFSLNPPNSVTFSDLTQAPEIKCTACSGNGYMTSPGT